MVGGSPPHEGTLNTKKYERTTKKRDERGGESRMIAEPTILTIKSFGSECKQGEGGKRLRSEKSPIDRKKKKKRD